MNDVATSSTAPRALLQRDRCFSLSLDLLSLLGFDGRLLQLNPARVTTRGHALDERLEPPSIGFAHPDDRPATLREAEQIEAGLG